MANLEIHDISDDEVFALLAMHRSWKQFGKPPPLTEPVQTPPAPIIASSTTSTSFPTTSITVPLTLEDPPKPKKHTPDSRPRPMLRPMEHCQYCHYYGCMLERHMRRDHPKESLPKSKAEEEPEILARKSLTVRTEEETV